MRFWNFGTSFSADSPKYTIKGRDFKFAHIKEYPFLQGSVSQNFEVLSGLVFRVVQKSSEKKSFFFIIYTAKWL